MIKDLIMDAKTDKDSMYVLIKQFEPLIDKYSRLLNYEEARTDLIIAFIELIHKIPCLETPKNISYINKSIKNTYIRFSKSNNKKLNIIPLNESFHNQADETIAYINEVINQLSHIQRRIIIYKIHGYSDVEIALKLKTSRQTVSRHKNKGIKLIKDYLK